MNELNKILNFIKKKRGLDFYGYHVSMLNRRIEKRLFETNSETLTEYLEFLNNNTSELDKLISVLTINVSRFFRNTFGFEYLSDYILPNILREKVTANDNTLRIWSAGSAAGEEAYSIAILINEIVKKEKLELNTTIIATDIDKNILEVAKKGIYNYKSIKSVKYRLLKKYFKEENDDSFRLKSKIKKMVNFSEFDLINKKQNVPPESIYGGFDIVLCRNVLIYFNPKFQEIIFEKLYNSLNPNGYLILGEAEVLSEKIKDKFIHTIKHCKIFKKR